MSEQVSHAMRSRSCNIACNSEADCTIVRAREHAAAWDMAHSRFYSPTLGCRWADLGVVDTAAHQCQTLWQQMACTSSTNDVEHREAAPLLPHGLDYRGR